MLQIVKENQELKNKVVADLERCKWGELENSWSVKKKRSDTMTGIFSKIAPQGAHMMNTVVDTVYQLRRREEGRHRQVIQQFIMRRHRDAFWKTTKKISNLQRPRDPLPGGLQKADQEVRAAVWLKMKRAQVVRKKLHYREHVGYINGTRVNTK